MSGSKNTASIYRSLAFSGSVPLSIRVASDELGPNADRAIDTYQIQAPRSSYLPLLLPEIRKTLLELVLDEAALSDLKEESVWFEHDGLPLRWHWSLGLLYDYCLAHSSRSPSQSAQPLDITLHLHSPPNDRLLLGPSADACRTNFMNLVKEADFVRWGSTRRVTQLRKVDQDALWEGLLQNDYDRFWSVASKLVPLPSASSRSPSPADAGAPSTLNDGRLPDANAMRSIPLRIYLPENVPVIQELVPPLQSGKPTTLYTALSTILPMLFPPRKQDMSASFISSKPLARIIIQGIIAPLDSEVGFLAATLSSLDGWLHLIVDLRP